MWLSILLLVVSLGLLTLGAELLVRGAAGIALRFGLSSFFVGLTIVGFGTSTPELATGITAAINGYDDINVGNVVGSNICNIALILGIAAIICPIPVSTRVVRQEVIPVALVSLIPLAALLNHGMILRWEAALMLVLLVAYIWRGYVLARRESKQTADAIEKEIEHELGLDRGGWRQTVWAQVVFVLLGLGILVGGSQLLVYASVDLARGLGVSELVIALTIIALGTSAPELFTSVVAALRKQADISVGNILGSNVFNILGVLAATSLVKPQKVSMQVIAFDTPLMIVLALACVPLMLSGGRISRLEGALLLMVYAAYSILLYTAVPGWFAESS